MSLKRFTIYYLFNDKEPCPICYDDLRFQEQTILSCTHVFHKKCLDSFERFQRLKGHDKACPICRKEDYDQKTYAEGMKRYLIRCIVSMQALARGFLQRNHFYQSMKDKGYNPTNGNKIHQNYDKHMEVPHASCGNITPHVKRMAWQWMQQHAFLDAPRITGLHNMFFKIKSGFMLLLPKFEQWLPLVNYGDGRSGPESLELIITSGYRNNARFICTHNTPLIIQRLTFNPTNGAMRRRFIGYKLGRIGKRYMSMMTKEREEILGTIQRVDKSIKDTDKLLDSFMPNMARIWQERREREKQEQAQNDLMEQVREQFSDIPYITVDIS